MRLACFNVVVSFSFTLIAVRNRCCSTEYKPFTVRDFAFTGWQYKALVKCSFQKCVQACKSEQACISVNFDKSCGNGIGFCALNDCGVEDEEDKGRSLVFTPGCLYHQLRPTEAALVKVRDMVLYVVYYVQSTKRSKRVCSSLGNSLIYLTWRQIVH